jgi:hypothetical protein
MKNERSIHNLDTLDKEIYRLQLEAKAKEKQLEENADFIRKNARHLFIDELFCRNKRKNSTENGGSQAGDAKSSRWTVFMEKLTDQFTQRAADGIENLFERMFAKKKKHH